MAGASALLRSAQAAAKKVQAQKDAEIQYEYSISPKSYDDFKRYSEYLMDRARKTSDPSAVLTYQKNADSAFKGYVSNEIQRKTIDTLEGRGTSIQKYNTILSFMDQAMSNGQYDLAQGLNLQLDNLSVSIQNEAKQAAEASKRLAEMESRAQAGANADMAQSLKNGLEALTAAFNQGGQLAYNKAAKTFVDQHRDQLKAMGVDVPKDYSTNIGQLISGTIKGIGQYYILASQAMALTDPSRAQDYKSKAEEIATGATKFSTPAGSLSLYDAMDIADNPGLFVESTDAYGKTTLKRSTLAGYQVDTQGNVTAKPTGYTSGGAENKDLKKQLEGLGFGDVQYDKNSGSYKVKLTGETSKWFKASDIGKTDNAELYLIPTDSGFQYYDKGNKKLYNIARDQKGLGGLYQVNNLNQQTHLGGQYGFNQGANSLIKQASFLQTKKQMDEFQRVLNNSNQSNLGQNLTGAANNYLKSVGQNPGLTYKAAINQGYQPQQLAQQSAWALTRTFLPVNSTPSFGKFWNYAGNPIPGYSQRNGGGFNFVDANGKAISALTYSQQTHSDFSQLLNFMASKGDTYAGQFAKNPNAAPSALTWR